MEEIELRKKVSEYKLLFVVTALASLVFIALSVQAIFTIKQGYSELILGTVGLVVVPLIASLFFGILEKLNFIDTPQIVEKGIIKNIEAQMALHKKCVNEDFKDEIRKLGSIYFTGIVKQLSITGIFKNITRPRDFDFDGADHLTSKLLFIGISQDVIPNFVYNDMIEHQEVINTEHKYQILYSLNHDISRIRFDSMIKKHYDVNGPEEYIKQNTDKANILQNDLKGQGILSPIFEFKQHNVYPFGLLLVHGNYIWFSMLWNHQNSKNESVVLEIRRDSNFGRELIKSFNEIWNRE